jgi:hypothetical protein
MFDIVVSAWGDFSLLSMLYFMVYDQSTYMGFVMRAQPDDADFNLFKSKIEEAYAATTLADKYARTHEASQMCMDNCYVIFPYNTNTSVVWSSFTKGSRIDVQALGPDFRNTVINT